MTLGTQPRSPSLWEGCQPFRDRPSGSKPPLPVLRPFTGAGGDAGAPPLVTDEVEVWGPSTPSQDSSEGPFRLLSPLWGWERLFRSPLCSSSHLILCPALLPSLLWPSQPLWILISARLPSSIWRSPRSAEVCALSPGRKHGQSWGAPRLFPSQKDDPPTLPVVLLKCFLL